MSESEVNEKSGRRLVVALMVSSKNDAGEWKLRGSKSLTFPLPETPVTVDQLEALAAQVAQAFNAGALNAMGNLKRPVKVERANILD